MRDNNYGKFLIYAVLLFLIGTTSSFAQEQDREKERAKEHQAVKDYISRHLPEYSPDENYTPSKGKPEVNKNILLKPNQQADRKSYLMNGNKVNVEIWNYGGIGGGYNAIREVGGVVWRNLSYIFQFSPLVGAEVENAETGEKLRIISDGLWDYPRSGLREWDPENQDFLWQWQPLEGYADPDQDKIAHNPDVDTDGDGKPDSWPRHWYNETLGEYVWPGLLSQNAVNAEAEVFWGMDDRDNKEFPYYPFPSDSSRKGLGVQIDGRAFQWSNVLAENSVFFVYTITNVSDKPLDKVFFGIYGDPDIGGGGVFNLNKGFFIPPYADDGSVDNIPVYARSLVYFWNPEGQGERGLPTGYLACKFLESPGAIDGIDNDGDGMIDEKQDDGIDNDGDWNPDGDDVGVDGVAGTDDEGEGDGVPTPGKKLADGSLDPLFPGEPNFELTDLDESDQIGLTSFNSWIWETDAVSNDVSMWNRSIPGNFDEIQEEPDDLVFIFGSGYIDLQPGETKRISMALLMGEDLDDLLTTSETVQRIYNQNYRFFKPPFTPTVTAVPGDEKVTLYWDDLAEESIDPITGKDFQGYVIYRSTDPNFNDIQVVTDGKGSRYLSEPLKKADGTEAKWDLAVTVEPFTDLNNNNKWDSGEPYEDINGDGRYSGEIEDPWQGYHPVPYQGRGIHYFLGNNSGLVHSFVDSNDVVNGQTYYYAVVAYDRGDSEGIPPSETTKKITRDPITGEMVFDRNTVQVIPGPRAAGYIEPAIKNDNILHIGRGNGNVDFTLLNDLALEEGGEYKLFFSDSLDRQSDTIEAKNYSVLKLQPVRETVKLFDTKFSQLFNDNVSDDEFLSVIQENGDTPILYEEGVDYEVSYNRGTIRRIEGSSIPSGSSVEVTYRYYPVYQSINFEGEDSNPTFDGVELTITDYSTVEIDEEETGWISGGTNLSYNIILSTIGRASQKLKYPGDFEVTFSDQEEFESRVAEAGTDSTVSIDVNFKVEEVTNGIAEPIKTLLIEQKTQKDSSWDPGDLIIFFKPGSKGLQTDTLTWMLNLIVPGDADSNFVPDLPGTGDVLYIATERPFTEQDTFYLKTEGPKVAQNLKEESLDEIYVVPNPYIGYSIIEPTNKLPGQSRGERRIYFENLPQQCTIRIFTLSGEPVTTLYHESSMSNGREYWNLLNRDGFGVAYGVYMAHIEAPGIGEKLLKFALIK